MTTRTDHTELSIGVSTHNVETTSDYKPGCADDVRQTNGKPFTNVLSTAPMTTWSPA